jgi:hypothetical protein
MQSAKVISPRLDPRAALCQLPMDIAMEEAYLLWYVQRTELRSAENGIARRVEQVSE